MEFPGPLASARRLAADLDGDAIDETRGTHTPPSEISLRVLPFEKVYSGALVDGRREVSVQGESSLLPLRCLDFFTPGFAWGFHGGGPDELAIAILHDHFGSRQPVVEGRVLGLYRVFTDDVVSKFAYDRAWSLPAGMVEKWVGQREEPAIVG
jgi:hypothetical protein